MPLAAGGVALVLRTRGRPGPVMADVGRAVSSVEPGDIVYDVKTLDDILATSLAPRRVTMMLLAAFAGPVETPCALFRLERDRQHAIVDAPARAVFAFGWTTGNTRPETRRRRTRCLACICAAVGRLSETTNTAMQPLVNTARDTVSSFSNVRVGLAPAAPP